MNKLGYLNPQSSGAAADWASPTASRPNLGADSCNAFASKRALSLSNNDWFAMDALGSNLAAGSGLNTAACRPISPEAARARLEGAERRPGPAGPPSGSARRGALQTIRRPA